MLEKDIEYLENLKNQLEKEIEERKDYYNKLKEGNIEEIKDNKNNKIEIKDNQKNRVTLNLLIEENEKLKAKNKKLKTELEIIEQKIQEHNKINDNLESLNKENIK